MAALGYTHRKMSYKMTSNVYHYTRSSQWSKDRPPCVPVCFSRKYDYVRVPNSIKMCTPDYQIVKITNDYQRLPKITYVYLVWSSCFLDRNGHFLFRGRCMFVQLYGSSWFFIMQVTNLHSMIGQIMILSMGGMQSCHFKHARWHLGKMCTKILV